MRYDIEELRCASAMHETQNELAKYLYTSPRLEFGEGGSAMQARLSDLEQVDPAAAGTLSHIQISGWVSLELAAHFPAGRSRRNHIERAKERFGDVAKHPRSDGVEKRLDVYTAKLGLAAAYAYENPIEQTLEDNPGYYSQLLDEVRADHDFRSYSPTDRRGLISEITAAALISHCGYLVLPSAIRHDKTMSIERPKVAHDLQVWLTPPASLPQRPDRKVQVKTHYSDDDPRYCDSITMLSINDDLEECVSEQIAEALGRKYRGSSLNSQSNICLENNLAIVKDILHKKVGDKQQARFIPSPRSAAIGNRIRH